jgi:drug/metabolite transporter (DMT)-like permease
MNFKRNVLPYLAALVTYSVFGLSFLFSKKALGTVDPLTLLSFRFLTAFSVMSLLILFKFIKINYKGKQLRGLILLGLMQPLSYFIFETYGIKHSSSSQAGLMIALIPIVVCIMAAYFLKEKPTLIQCVFIIVSICGVALIILMNGSNGTNGNMLGIVLLFGAVISAAVFTIVSRKISSIFTSLELTYFMMSIGAISFTTLSISQHAYEGTFRNYFTPLLEKDFIIGIIYLGILSSIVAFLLMNYTLSKIEASRASVFSSLTTVVSIAAGVIIMKESFEYYHAFGSAMIIVGVWGTNYFGVRKKFAVDTKVLAEEI